MENTLWHWAVKEKRKDPKKGTEKEKMFIIEQNYNLPLICHKIKIWATLWEKMLELILNL